MIIDCYYNHGNTYTISHSPINRSTASSYSSYYGSSSKIDKKKKYDPYLDMDVPPYLVPELFSDEPHKVPVIYNKVEKKLCYNSVSNINRKFKPLRLLPSMSGWRGDTLKRRLGKL